MIPRLLERGSEVQGVKMGEKLRDIRVTYAFTTGLVGKFPGENCCGSTVARDDGRNFNGHGQCLSHKKKPVRCYGKSSKES